MWLLATEVGRLHIAKIKLPDVLGGSCKKQGRAKRDQEAFSKRGTWPHLRRERLRPGPLTGQGLRAVTYRKSFSPPKRPNDSKHSKVIS